MLDHKRIQKECFQEMKISREELEKIIQGEDFSAKTLVFQKILENSSQVLYDLKNFNSDDIATLLENYKVPQFNHDYFFRRKNIAEAFFLNKPILVKELQWQA